MSEAKKNTSGEKSKVKRLSQATVDYTKCAFRDPLK